MIKDYFLKYEAMNNDFTICLGKRHAMEFHGEHQEQDFRVCLADTGQETMTGGRLKRVARYIDTDTFILTYGDGLADVNIRELLNFHESHGRIATVTTVRPTSRFGLLDSTEDGQVSRFAEKPQSQSWASAGFFVFNRRIFDYLEDEGDDCILERGPLERLTAAGQLMAYRHDGFFFAMDTYREYQYLNELWEQGKAPWKVWK